MPRLPGGTGRRLEALYAAGAWPARRGEFTKRAFLNGRMDLTQAEAVIDLIEAETADAAANAAGQVGGALLRQLEPVYSQLTDLCSHFHAVLDYPDEDIDDFRLTAYAGTLARCQGGVGKHAGHGGAGPGAEAGGTGGTAGQAKCGQVQLAHALAGFPRAIVTAQPGTTRDTVEEPVLVGSVRLRLVDTAGIRQTHDEIEAMGVERARQAAQGADLALFVCDGSRPLDQEDQAAMAAALTAPQAICLLNKQDLPQVVDRGALPFATVVPICAKTGQGLEALAPVLEEMFGGGAPCDGSVLTNVRQVEPWAGRSGPWSRPKPLW